MKNRAQFLLAGIAFRIHPLFWLVFVASVATGYFLEIMTLFAIVLIHEMGHVFTAKAYRWRIREVQLLPFGGVAQVEQQKETPGREETVVALAGPLMNLLMAPFALLFHGLGWWDANWAAYFLSANLLIAGFNLLPVYPLDGGKVLLAGFYRFRPYYLSLHWIVLLGSLGASAMILLACAWVMRGAGLRFDLLFLGAFLLSENWREYRQIPYRMLRFLFHRYEGDAAGESYPLIQVPFRPSQKVRQLTERMYKGRRHLFCAQKGRNEPLFLAEQELLRFYFEEQAPHKEIRELL